MSSNALPPLQALTPDDHGAIVVVIAYCFAGFTLVGAGARTAITVVQKQGFHRDDIGYFGGALLSFIMSVLCERAVDVGLGRHLDKLDAPLINSFHKITYAAFLLGLFAMLGAKISIVLLYQRIAPQQASMGILFLYGCIAVWAIFAILAQAFQCGGSVQFFPDQCVSGKLQYPSIILNIVTDALLSFWMAPRIWSLQSSTKARVVPIILFGLRVFVCFVAIAQLVVYAYNIGSEDQSWAQVMPWTLNIVVVHLSVFHATLPRINSFIVDFSTGQIDLRVADRDIELMENSKSGNSKDRSGTFPPSKFITSQLKSPQQSKTNSQIQNSQISSFKGKGKAAKSRDQWPAERTSSEELRTTCYTKRESDLNSRDYTGDADETGSQSSLSRNAVYQTVEFRWEEEYEAGKSKPREIPL